MIFALVAAAIVMATLVTFAITFVGPPPRERPVSERDIVLALQGNKVTGLRIADGNAAPRYGERRQASRDQRIHAILGRGKVIGYYVGSEAIAGEVRGNFTVNWSSRGGQRSVRNEGSSVLTHWLIFTVGGMAMALIFLLIPAWLLAQAISRPLRDLAISARQIRAGEPFTVPATTSAEVQDLGAALAAMHRRVTDAIEGRTVMLAAIAHDLGTPLSRLAFYTDALPEPERSKAAKDLDEMRSMIGAAIGFARDEAHSQPMMRLDLGSLLDSLAEDMLAAGQPVSLNLGVRVIVNGDPVALRRLFSNLIDNAIAYGTEARIDWHVEHEYVVVCVRDRGPGIDPAEAEKMFEPFVRGDPSRSRSTGGTGLGLAIVRSVAVRHSGHVSLGSTSDGAVATTVLPIVTARYKAL
ncbi:ATP-binding protein [Sphingomonas sp. STIS6.2]|uniref:ATP-binding protein n=1 Tax=Sphingomonas sp. STIS6.2 TaxID=1379700 RepID=UPI00131B8F45|nr:ATP-binding protein [Sphingomonas sp. STIS6.2]